MNLYVVTEGKSENEIYKCWIPFVNSNLTLIDSPEKVNRNNFYIVSGKGYPFYFETIEDAIEDVNLYPAFDKLVISVDSDQMTRMEKYDEIEDFISNKHCSAQIIIVIQHFCFETWALGNRKIIKPIPSSQQLRDYINLFNVRINDPELLPDKSDEELNRSQFAHKYLKLAFREKYRNLTYNKNRPKALLNYSFFNQVKRRFMGTSHIASFQEFLNAFV